MKKIEIKMRLKKKLKRKKDARKKKEKRKDGLWRIKDEIEKNVKDAVW